MLTNTGFDTDWTFMSLFLTFEMRCFKGTQTLSKQHTLNLLINWGKAHPGNPSLFPCSLACGYMILESFRSTLKNVEYPELLSTSFNFSM